MIDIPKRVAITGASGFLGTATIEALTQTVEYTQPEIIVAIDIKPTPKPQKCRSEFVSISDRVISEPIDDILNKYAIDCFIHLAFQMPGRMNTATVYETNIKSVYTTVQSCKSANVKQYMYASSTTVYGAHADFKKPYTEIDPPRPLKGFPYSQHKLLNENALLEFAKTNTDMCISILRICPVTGDGKKNFMNSIFSLPFLPSHLGINPQLQLLEINDYKSILLKTLYLKVNGIFNVAGKGSIAWGSVASAMGIRSIPIPLFITKLGTYVSWKTSLQKFSDTSGLDLIKWPWLVSTKKAEDVMGWQPTFDAPTALKMWTETRKTTRV